MEYDQNPRDTLEKNTQVEKKEEGNGVFDI